MFSKIRIIRTSNGGARIRCRELQLFINDDNKAPGNDSFTTGDSRFVDRLNDQSLGSTYFTSSSIGDNVGVNCNAYFSKYDIQSIVFYNITDTSKIDSAEGLKIELLNANDNIRVSSS